jgi:hypothetical protein
MIIQNKKRLTVKKMCRVIFDNLEFSGISGKFYLTVIPAEEGYKGTSNQLVILYSYISDTSTILYIWKEGESVSSRLLDLFSSFPLLQRLIKL